MLRAACAAFFCCIPNARTRTGAAHTEPGNSIAHATPRPRAVAARRVCWLRAPRTRFESAARPPRRACGGYPASFSSTALCLGVLCSDDHKPALRNAQLSAPEKRSVFAPHRGALGQAEFEVGGLCGIEPEASRWTHASDAHPQPCAGVRFAAMLKNRLCETRSSPRPRSGPPSHPITARSDRRSSRSVGFVGSNQRRGSGHAHHTPQALLHAVRRAPCALLMRPPPHLPSRATGGPYVDTRGACGRSGRLFALRALSVALSQRAAAT
jgi:hypothetical protein